MNQKNETNEESPNPYEPPVGEKLTVKPESGFRSAVFLFLLVPILLIGFGILILIFTAIGTLSFPVQPD